MKSQKKTNEFTQKNNGITKNYRFHKKQMNSENTRPISQKK